MLKFFIVLRCKKNYLFGDYFNNIFIVFSFYEISLFRSIVYRIYIAIATN